MKVLYSEGGANHEDTESCARRLPDGEVPVVLVEPSLRILAACLGMARQSKIYDLAQGRKLSKTVK